MNFQHDAAKASYLVQVSWGSVGWGGFLVFVVTPHLEGDNIGGLFLAGGVSLSDGIRLIGFLQFLVGSGKTPKSTVLVGVGYSHIRDCILGVYHHYIWTTVYIHMHKYISMYIYCHI